MQGVQHRIFVGFFELVWFGLMLNVPVNNFSVMLGRSHRFLGITNSFFFFGGGGAGGGTYVLLNDITR